MADVQDPTPAELPLPGGRQGATVRVHPLLCGEGAWPDAWPHREEGRLARMHALGFGVPRKRWVRLPIVAFLVEHPGAGPILVDTGLDPVVADDQKKSFGRVLGATSTKTFSMEPSQAVPEQLRARGVDPADVELVFLTHMHFDHTSGMGQFPGATFLLTEFEWDAANGPFSLLHGYVRRHFVRPVEYRSLDFESDHATSYATFGRTLDLFGDGSVRAVFTPGHTHGHMSLVLRTGGPEILVTADALYTRHALETGHLPAHMEDPHLFRRSLREIQIYHRQLPDSVVIPGHDFEAWDELPAVFG